MQKSRYLIILCILLICVNSVYAFFPFDAEVVPINDKIVVDEIAEFEVRITNNLDTEEQFTIKKAGYPFWDMYTKPLQNPITLTVPDQETASLRLFVDPLYITTVDTYTLPLGIVLDKTGDEIKVPLSVGIKSTDPLIGGYIPTVLTSTSITPSSDPREELEIKIVLNNQNVLDYENLTIKIDSNLIKDEIYATLGPKETKTLTIKKSVPDDTVPQKDQLIIAVFLDERMIVSPIVKDFEITGYEIRNPIPEEKSYLTSKKGIKVSSNDPDYTSTIKVETTRFKSLFTSTVPRARVEKEGDKQYFVWDVELDENREYEAHTYENYRPIPILIAIAIVIVILYFLFRSPLVTRKSVANISLRHGGISTAKVVVRVKNRSGKKLENIEVTDNIPKIAQVEKELSVGSMQPHAVLKHPKKGAVIKWKIEAIEAGDERVLSYRMKSTLPIIGEFNLPSANARTKVGRKIILSNSNRVTVGN